MSNTGNKGNASNYGNERNTGNKGNASNNGNTGNKGNTTGKITALYERLSVDDGSMDESNSIQNQKILLEQYAEKHGFTNIRHYTDDGISGLRFSDRPGYVQMMDDIEDGKVAVCLVKDVSRLGRDHLRVGMCMDAYVKHKLKKYAPFLQNIHIRHFSNTKQAVGSDLPRLPVLCFTL